MSYVLQEEGTISSVNSAGGHLSIENVSYESSSDSTGSSALLVSLSSGQSARFQYGEDLEIQELFNPTKKLIGADLGKVTGLSVSTALIVLVNSTIPKVVPLKWDPHPGDKVILTFNSEKSTPLIAITGLELDSSYSQFTAIVESPSCLRQQGVALVYGTCVQKALGHPIHVGFGFLTYPRCYGLPRSCAVSVTSEDPRFSVTQIEPYAIGTGVIIKIAMPNIDFVGAIPLKFSFVGT